MTDRGELVYLVMELLDGVTLTAVLAREQLAPVRAIRIARQIADALAASHARGVVHRDLKPANVMLVTRGRDPDFVKLLDFGIAKLTGAASSSVRTRTGMLMGTPTYMSPEQCEGRATLDHRTDIYALGILMYQLLTGRVPFQGEGYGEILVQHMTAEPPPMSAFRPGIPPHLEQIVMKTLRKRPDDRFASMTELLEALRDPIGYVDARGGLAGFAPARTGATPHAATIMVPPAMTPPTQTTLSHSVGETQVLAKRRGDDRRGGGRRHGARDRVRDRGPRVERRQHCARTLGDWGRATRGARARGCNGPAPAPIAVTPPAPIAVTPPAPIDAGVASVAIAPKPDAAPAHPSRRATATPAPRPVGDDTLDPFAK